MANKKKKKKKHLLGKNEFIFNFISLVLIILVAVYFGGRSLYYYSKQNMRLSETKETLNGVIIQNNQLNKDGDTGFYRDGDGYFFKGTVNNNYLAIGNVLYRIIRVNNDESVRIVADNYVSSFIWGDEVDYQKSNVHTWLEKNEEEYSGVYYDTLPDIKKYFKKTNYREGTLKKDNISSSKKEYSEYVTLLNLSDYVTAGGKKSYLHNNQLFFLLGYDKEKNNLYVEEDGSIQTCETTDGYGIRPVMTLKKNQVITGGDGTIQNPYNLKVDNYGYVNRYVKLGADIWYVYENRNGILKMYQPYNYLVMNGYEFVRNYSNYNSVFDLSDKQGLAYFLNMVYYNTLTYQGVLVDNDYYIGEISDDNGYQIKNIYSNKVTCKVGLLNIFDYNPNVSFNDYFHINTTSSVGSMQYNRLTNGLLEEADVREEKHIVPVISILSSSLKSGTGTFNDPYVVG